MAAGRLRTKKIGECRMQFSFRSLFNHAIVHLILPFDISFDVDTLIIWLQCSLQLIDSWIVERNGSIIWKDI